MDDLRVKLTDRQLVSLFTPGATLVWSTKKLNYRKSLSHYGGRMKTAHSMKIDVQDRMWTSPFSGHKMVIQLVLAMACHIGNKCHQLNGGGND